MNLNEFHEEVTKKIDKGRSVDVVYIDISKWLDMVLHGRLL